MKRSWGLFFSLVAFDFVGVVAREVLLPLPLRVELGLKRLRWGKFSLFEIVRERRGVVGVVGVPKPPLVDRDDEDGLWKLLGDFSLLFLSW